MGYDRLPDKFCHPDDVRQRKAEQHQRNRDRADAAFAPGRVYQLIGDSSPLPEVGDVTRSSNSAIVWNAARQMWEHATPDTYGRALGSKQASKLVRVVKPVSGNRQAGGSF